MHAEWRRNTPSRGRWGALDWRGRSSIVDWVMTWWMSISADEEIDGWYVVTCEFVDGREVERWREGPLDEDAAKEHASAFDVVRSVKEAFGYSATT